MNPRQLLACPVCRGELSAAWMCASCGACFAAADGIPKLTLDVDARTDVVRRFYDEAPFPGYPPRDDLSSFRARAERSEFAQLLDRAIAGDARVVEVGCGTDQMALFLARADRTVIGVDVSRQALLAGASAARRLGVRSVQFVEMDLHRPGLRPDSFDVVYSAGVLHTLRIHAPRSDASYTWPGLAASSSSACITPSRGSPSACDVRSHG
jgi:SAM-dependent methyltransferase